MLVQEYLHNLFYDIYEGYPLFIFKEITTDFGNKINYLSIKKIKYDTNKKILFFIENKDTYLYIPLAKANNINTKLFNDLIQLNIDMAIVASLKDINELEESELYDFETNFLLQGKKIPFEFFKTE